MDLSDDYFIDNHDWDPSYLMDIFTQDFESFDSLWCSTISDIELVHNVEQVEKYCPITEDISMDDNVLCSAVEKIEEE